MAFHEINMSSRYGPELKQLGKLLRLARESAATNAARNANMTDDAQSRAQFGFQNLTKAQIQTTLDNLVSQLTHSSIDAIVEQIG